MAAGALRRPAGTGRSPLAALGPPLRSVSGLTSALTLAMCDVLCSFLGGAARGFGCTGVLQSFHTLLRVETETKQSSTAAATPPVTPRSSHQWPNTRPPALTPSPRPSLWRSLQLEWKKLREGSYRGHAYEVFKGTFPTPCFGKIYDALPPESRTASAMWVVPKRPAHTTACMVHLAATGDHGYARRMHLGLPLVEQVRGWGWRLGLGLSDRALLGRCFYHVRATPPRNVIEQEEALGCCAPSTSFVGFDVSFLGFWGAAEATAGLCAAQGIATLALESPYYGERKPGYQQGAKLHRVSDLLLLGRATIEESLFLLQWLSRQGFAKLGACGRVRWSAWEAVDGKGGGPNRAGNCWSPGSSPLLLCLCCLQACLLSFRSCPCMHLDSPLPPVHAPAATASLTTCPPSHTASKPGFYLL